MKKSLLRALRHLARQQLRGKSASRGISSRDFALLHRHHSTLLDPTPTVHHRNLHDDSRMRLGHTHHQKQPRPLDNPRHNSFRLELGVMYQYTNWKI